MAGRNSLRRDALSKHSCRPPSESVKYRSVSGKKDKYEKKPKTKQKNKALSDGLLLQPVSKDRRRMYRVKFWANPAAMEDIFVNPRLSRLVSKEVVRLLTR